MRETESAGFLREQAEKCRRLAGTVNDTKAIASLRKLAAHYQERAASVRKTRPQFPAQKPRRPSASVRFPPKADLGQTISRSDLYFIEPVSCA